MGSSSRDMYNRIDTLLHDGRVADIQWDQALGTFAVGFRCLRRAPDGSDLSDDPVLFRAGGVEAVAVAYDSCSLAARPSTFSVRRSISAAELAEWPFQQQEADLWINSSFSDKALSSAIVQWLRGDQADYRNSKLRLCLSFDGWAGFGQPLMNVRLLIGGEDLAITSHGSQLDIDDWEQEFRAWWEGWQEHWSKDSQGQDAKQSEYDACIPAGESKPLDASYRPPAEPVFELEATDAPAAILEPIRAWFQSPHSGDWRALARAFPGYDHAPEERATQLAEEHTDLLQEWNYARVVDDWWMEGGRACVTMRGVEHCPPVDGDPAENREAVWVFSLRMYHGQWIIDTYSTALAKPGAAPALGTQSNSWLQRWTSGEVR